MLTQYSHFLLLHPRSMSTNAHTHSCTSQPELAANSTLPLLVQMKTILCFTAMAILSTISALSTAAPELEQLRSENDRSFEQLRAETAQAIAKMEDEKAESLQQERAMRLQEERLRFERNRTPEPQRERDLDKLLRDVHGGGVNPFTNEVHIERNRTPEPQRERDLDKLLRDVHGGGVNPFTNEVHIERNRTPEPQRERDLDELLRDVHGGGVNPFTNEVDRRVLQNERRAEPTPRPPAYGVPRSGSEAETATLREMAERLQLLIKQLKDLPKPVTKILPPSI